MKIALLLGLSVSLLFGACSEATQHPPTARAQVDADPPAWAAPSAPDDAWSQAVVAAKVAGSLYRIGAFFPPAADVVDPAVARP